MTEAELNIVRMQARTGEAKAEYELAVLYANDFFKRRAIFTLRPIYKQILKLLEDIVDQHCVPETALQLEESFSSFRQNPSVSTLESLIGNIIVASNQNEPQNSWKITQRLTEAIHLLGNSLPSIIEEHFPEWHRLTDLAMAVNGFSESPDIGSLESLLLMLNAASKKKGEKNLVLQLLADSASKGHHPALQKLGVIYGIKTKDLVLEDGIARPIMSAVNNLHYPSIVTGLYHPAIKFQGMRVKFPVTLPMFDEGADPLNRFVTILHDENSFDSRKAAFSHTQTLLSSVMAWAGPHCFSIDVLDFDNSGIGAQVASYLPAKEIKILTKEEDWEKELYDLNTIMDKRTSRFSHFMNYNSENPDMKEPLKIVIVRDLSGELISVGTEPSREANIETQSAYESHKQQVEKFKLLLRRGFQYGMIFIINTSDLDAYTFSPFCIDCTSDMSMPQDAFDCIRIEGTNKHDDNWLLRYLAGGKTPIKRQRELESSASAHDGILTTCASEENPDAEFRMDTVNHIHAFVIGQTGSGKSRLLHNIITGLALRYGPEDLMLYLLDLKMGGVELNRYRNLPQLRSLLVDNSDIQIVLEILRDIELMMRERGKIIRDTNCSDIKKYNHAYPNSKMPQVIIFIDECHQIFSMGSRGSGFSKEQRAITDLLAMIAKEGRSQGIHLVFATQTLSGSEIPSEIQKSITDFYFLKCSPSDSESLVRGSSNKTEVLPLGGKVYYHHANKQLYFQGTFLDDPQIDTIVEEVDKRYSKSRGHGQLYFNGAQTFSLDLQNLETIAGDADMGIKGAVGRKINLQQDIVKVNLQKDYAENVLLCGINNERQLDRTSMALLVSQIATAKLGGSFIKTYVIDCSPKGSETASFLQNLQMKGDISLFKAAESERLLKELCDNVKNNTLISPTLLYLIGQDRFSEMKRDLPFKKDTDFGDMSEGDSTADLLFSGINFSGVSKANAEYDSYRKAVRFLLNNGPTAGLHTHIQLEKSDNLLFEDYISAKMVNSFFKHIILLKSDNRTAMQLGLDDDLKPELLSADPMRLRAYYYNDDSGETSLFSPFEEPNINDYNLSN